MYFIVILREPDIYLISKEIHDPKDLGIHLGLKFSEEIIPIVKEHIPDTQAVAYHIITVSIIITSKFSKDYKSAPLLLSFLALDGSNNSMGRSRPTEETEECFGENQQQKRLHKH